MRIIRNWIILTHTPIIIVSAKGRGFMLIRWGMKQIAY